MLRRQQRAMIEKARLQQVLLEEADAEKYFARHGRDSLRQVMAEAAKKKKLDHIHCYCTPWDEFHRQYDRDMEAGGNTFTREANYLAVLALDAIRSGKGPEGRLLQSAHGFLARYHFDWERYPDLALMELSVCLYAVLTKQVGWNYYCDYKRNQWEQHYNEGTPRGYWAKQMADREQQEHLMKTNQHYRHNW